MNRQNEKYIVFSSTFKLYVQRIERDRRLTEGFDGLLSDLERLVCLAHAMNRIAVIGLCLLNPIHNFGMSGVKPWSKYIDLDKTELYKRKENGLLKKEPSSLRWIFAGDLFNEAFPRQSQIRKINREQLYDDENERYKVLVLDKIGWNITMPYYAKFVPSRAVNELTDIVLNRFGTSRAVMSAAQDLFANRCSTAHLFEKTRNEQFFYACLHIRANDILLGGELAHFHSIQRKHIEKFVYSACPPGTKIYIMSDMHNPRYFDFLRTRYDVYTYHDFPQLRQLVGGENDGVDNYMLFSVEKNIMVHALVKLVAFRWMPILFFQSDFVYSIPLITELRFLTMRRYKNYGISSLVKLSYFASLYKVLVRRDSTNRIKSFIRSGRIYFCYRKIKDIFLNRIQ